MALKQLLLIVLGTQALGCSQTPPPKAHAGERPALSVTRWTERTELFAEYPALVAGQTSRFAIHLTRLEPFSAVSEGHVEVRLEGGGTDPEVFRVESPARPGIFGVDVTPSHHGTRQLVIALSAPGSSDEHRVGAVEIYATPQAAMSADQGGEEAPGISFLKEQQWSLDFGTALVTGRSLRDSVRVSARFEGRPGGVADAVAPIAGRISRVADAALGERVEAGQELARLLPAPAAPGDLPQLQRTRAEGRALLALATRDRERAERLTTAGAAPARRLDEARAAEEQAQIRLSAADATLDQYNSARGGSAIDSDAAFVVRAPVTGVVAERNAAIGTNIAAGSVLFRIVDAALLHVVGHIPETQMARARLARAAEIEIPGQEERVSAGRLISIGRVMDPLSRTLPITFAFDNRALAAPVGQAVLLHLLMDHTPVAPVVPAAAIIDDAGRPIVFVQRAGETFERRTVTLGPRTGALVQVTAGVKGGDRVVTKGAYLVRLASLSTSVPAHGHVH